MACAGWLEARDTYDALVALLSSPRRAMAGAVVAVGPVAQVAGYTVCGPVLQHRTQKQVAQLAAQLGAL